MRHHPIKAGKVKGSKQSIGSMVNEKQNDPFCATVVWNLLIHLIHLPAFYELGSLGPASERSSGLKLLKPAGNFSRKLQILNGLSS
jgi:hypothetical protein